jgi:hypothetical protein
MTLLPYNSTKFERDVEAAIKCAADVSLLFGFRFKNADLQLRLALDLEYSLAQMNIDEFAEHVLKGLEFHRLRGTPAALRNALSWYGRFTLSETPTRNLFIRVRYNFSDGSGYTIRELGLFINSETDGELPPGQEYFLPNQVIDPGILLLIEHEPAMIRTPAVRESFAFVVTF